MGPYADGYSKGSEIFALDQEINQMVSLHKSKEAELSALDDQIHLAETKLVAKAGSQAERVSQLDHYNHLKEDRNVLVNDLVGLDQDIAAKRQQRDALFAQHNR